MTIRPSPSGNARERRALARARQHQQQQHQDTPSTVVPDPDDPEPQFIVGEPRPEVPDEGSPVVVPLQSTEQVDGSSSAALGSSSDAPGPNGLATQPGAVPPDGRAHLTSGYASSFETAQDDADSPTPWTSPRWETRRNKCRDALPIPAMDTFPPSGYRPNT